MEGQPPLELALDDLPDTAVVADLVYSPLETALLAAARARGCVALDGLGMLLHQARPCFAAWFGPDPQVTEALRAFVLGASSAAAMLVIGITGSIGKGKTNAAGVLRRIGTPGHRSDGRRLGT